MYTMNELVPEFIIAWVLDFISSLFVIIFAVKYFRLGVHEFYHNFIVVFLIIAYYFRISEIVFLITTKQEHIFNRNFGHSNRLEFILVYVPLLFHGLTGLAYLFRWSSYLVLTTAKSELIEENITKRLKYLKLMFLFIWLIMGIIMTVVFIGMFPFMIVSIAIIVEYLLTSIGLLIITNVFLRIIKLHKYSFYKEKSSIVRWYTTTISLWMFYRGISEGFDIALQPHLKNNSTAFEIVVDIIVLSNLFTEIIPSLLINFVLWKSYKEIKHLKESASLKTTDTIIKNNIEENLIVSDKNRVLNLTSFHESKHEQPSREVSKITDFGDNIESFIFDYSFRNNECSTDDKVQLTYF